MKVPPPNEPSPRCLPSSLICLLLLPVFGEATAQDYLTETEYLNSRRPEAWAMNYFTSVSLFSGFGAPRSRALGSIEIGAEVDWIPQLSRADRKVGFNGEKDEYLNKAPIFARPRVTVGLPGRFSLTLSYLPPIRIFGLKPNLFAAALERPLFERDAWTFGVRMYGQIGDVEGALTCPGDVAKFPPGSPQNLYGCEGKSADKAVQRYAGLEFSGSYRLDALGGLTPYLTVAGNYLDTEVRVHNLTFGVRDRRHLEAQSWTFSMGAGLSYPLPEGLTLNVGMFYSPLWVTRPSATSSQNDGLLNVRALLTVPLR